MVSIPPISIPPAPILHPYPAGERVLVFTGAMDYWANIDAVESFAREVPTIRHACPESHFYIVAALACGRGAASG